MHLAAESHVHRSIDGPVEFINTNVLGTYTLLEAAFAYWHKLGRRAQDFRFLHVSTDEVYSALKKEDYFTEESRYDQRSPYSASKIGADMMAESYARSFDLPVVVLRPFNTFGPRQSERAIVPTIIRISSARLVSPRSLVPTVAPSRMGFGSTPVTSYNGQALRSSETPSDGPATPRSGIFMIEQYDMK